MQSQCVRVVLMAGPIETIEVRPDAPLDERLDYYRRQAAAASEAAEKAVSASLSDAYTQLALAWLRLAEESARLGRPIF